jgi:hypothetical protein
VLLYNVLTSHLIKQVLSMPDSLMYQQENFVLLETNAPEQILTADELLYKLKIVLEKINNQDLPIDLQNLDSVDTQAQYLIDTSCELDIGPGKYLQWYAIRLEK